MQIDNSPAPTLRVGQIVAASSLAGTALLALPRLPGASIGLHVTLLPILCMLVLWWQRQGLPPTIRRHRSMLGALSLLALAGGLSAALSEHQTIALQAWLKYVLLGLILLTLLVLLERDRGRAADTRCDALSLFVLWTATAALVGVIEMVWPDLRLFQMLRDQQARSIQPRVAALFLWPNQYGALLVAALVCCAAPTGRWLAGRRGWFLLPLLTLQLAACGSRSSWLLLLGCCVWLAWRQPAGRLRGAAMMALLAAWCVTVPAASRQLGLQSPWFGLFPSTEVARAGAPERGDTGRSLSGRTDLWRAAAGTFREHPLVGVGPDVFERTVGREVTGRRGFNAHSLPLSIAAELGLLGLSAGLLLLAAWLRAARGAPLALVVAPLSLLLAQLTDCFLYDFGFLVWWAWLAAAAAAASGGARPQSVSQRSGS